MRRATSAQVPRGAGTARIFQFPAPIGGLNARDPLPMIPATECHAIGDFFPGVTGMVLRRGFSAHITGTSTPESLMVYTNNSGTQAMFAAISTAFYDVSSSGALGASVVSGLTNARWQHINFTNSSGTSYLCAFNGADSPQYWEGATWTAITGVSTPAITGLTTSTIVSAAVHQRRMWLIQVNSLKAWYLPVDSVGGAAAALDLGGIASKGGYIVAAEVWTVDGGDGIDDLLLFVTSQGQLIAFAGTDPSSASTWQHVGTWDIAQPIGRRCLYQYKGDVLIITSAGAASAARIMAGDSGATAMLTDKISGDYLSIASGDTPATFGWSLFYFPAQTMLLLATAGSYTYVMNTITGAWGQFDLGAVNCWALFNSEAYFGRSSTGVKKFWANSALDNGATTITGTIKQGHSDCGLPGVIKKSGLARAMVSDELYDIGIITGADFSDQATPSAQVALSGSSTYSMAEWLPVRAVGQFLSVSFAAQSKTGAGASADPFSYSGALITYTPGGIVSFSHGI